MPSQDLASSVERVLTVYAEQTCENGTGDREQCHAALDMLGVHIFDTDIESWAEEWALRNQWLADPHAMFEDRYGTRGTSGEVETFAGYQVADAEDWLRNVILRAVRGAEQARRTA